MFLVQPFWNSSAPRLVVYKRRFAMALRGVFAIRNGVGAA